MEKVHKMKLIDNLPHLFARVLKVVEEISTKLAPVVNELVRMIEDNIKKLSEFEVQVSDLRRKLISCKETVIKMLNKVLKYIESVEKFLCYGNLNKSRELAIKKNYKVLISQANISETIVETVQSIYFWLPVPVFLIVGPVGVVLFIVYVAVAMWIAMKWKPVSAQKSIQTYIDTLAQYLKTSEKTCKEFQSQCQLAKNECDKACDICTTVLKYVQDSKDPIKYKGAVAAVSALTGAAGVWLATGAGAVAILTPPVGVPIVLGLAISGGVLAIGTVTLLQRYEKISQDLHKIRRYFVKLNVVASECSSDVDGIEGKMQSIDDDRLLVNDHLNTAEHHDYSSFCQVLDIMLKSIRRSEVDVREKCDTAKHKLKKILNQI